MRDERASCIVVDLKNGELGILTDHDMRSRVVAAGRSLQTPVEEVMSAPAFTAAPQQTGDELMLAMLDRGIRHVPVLSSRGELLASSTTSTCSQPRRERRSCCGARSRTRRRGRPSPDAAQLDRTLIALHEGGVDATRISAILSVLVDALVRRSIELSIAAHGSPPATFGWLSLGSFGRREAVPSSDSIRGWSGPTPLARTRRLHARLASDVVDNMAAMGWKLDPHGVTATGVMSASSIGDWQAAIREWLEPPTSNEELVAISIVLDARAIYGPDGELDLRSLIRDAHPRPALLRLLLRSALASKPPTGFLKDIVVEHSGEHAGHFDVKHGGLLPIVNIARYAALAAGAMTTSTSERLRAAAEAGTLTETDAATLGEAFDFISDLRLEHQIRALEAASLPNDLINPKTLNSLTRRYLRETFRAVASVQKSLSTKLAWST